MEQNSENHPRESSLRSGGPRPVPGPPKEPVALVLVTLDHQRSRLCQALGLDGSPSQPASVEAAPWTALSWQRSVYEAVAAVVQARRHQQMVIVSIMVDYLEPSEFTVFDCLEKMPGVQTIAFTVFASAQKLTEARLHGATQAIPVDLLAGAVASACSELTAGIVPDAVARPSPVGPHDSVEQPLAKDLAPTAMGSPELAQTQKTHVGDEPAAAPTVEPAIITGNDSHNETRLSQAELDALLG